MSRALAALAARYVGRRVRLHSGDVGTISRVTSRGFVIALEPITAPDIAEWITE